MKKSITFDNTDTIHNRLLVLESCMKYLEDTHDIPTHKRLDIIKNTEHIKQGMLKILYPMYIELLQQDFGMFNDDKLAVYLNTTIERLKNIYVYIKEDTANENN